MWRIVVVRPRHTDKDIEDLIQTAESQDWRVAKGKKYFKMYCPCAEMHMKTVSLTPSDPNYLTNLRHWMRRTGCWKERR